MGHIHLLDPHVVNQIAAGEVIERPASVVKELVENALDAGARRIDVTLQDGGRALIEVADDGWGMDREDLERAFEAHATSKLETVEDLMHVASLGFRGEALASIGSVARVRITSRARDAEAGWTVLDDGGRIGAPEPSAASPGTVVRVEGLFARVPARRKFLRTAGTELGHVSALMSRFAVAHPDVAWRLVQGARVLLDAPPAPDRRARIGAVYGDEVADALLPVEGVAGGMRLEGWVGPPSLHRGDGRLEQTYLNGRHVKDRTLGHAVRQAYSGLMPPGGRRPVAFLFLTCPPEFVDVNVHPAKAEVRWRDTQTAHRLVHRALREVLEEAAPGVSVPLATPGVRGRTVETVELAFTSGAGRPAVGGAPGAVPGAAPPSARRADGVPPAPASGRLAGADTPRDASAPPAPPPQGAWTLRPVGRALGTYLVLEGPDEIVLVDQHALHERVLYERISARLEGEGRLEVQGLLVPAVVHLGPPETAMLLEASAILKSLGWEIEPFGDGAVAVQGVPAVLRRPDPEAALRDVLEVLERGAREGLDRTALLKDAVDRLACRSAVMAGDVLQDEEVLALLEQAESLDHAHSCPHGRPTRLTLSRSRLEHFFHRTV